MVNELELAVGDIAVYAGHGVARVVVRASRDVHGELREFVVFECAHGLSITLPLERARSTLRPVVTEADIRDVRDALRAQHSTSPDSWQRRLKATRAKIAGGKAVELAEIVRDGDLRVHWLKDRGSIGGLSTNERQLYRKARQLLADELGVSRGLEHAEAEAWIDAQLAQARAETEFTHPTAPRGSQRDQAWATLPPRSSVAAMVGLRSEDTHKPGA